jgi:hypothetical protein
MRKQKCFIMHAIPPKANMACSRRIIDVAKGKNQDNTSYGHGAHHQDSDGRNCEDRVILTVTRPHRLEKKTQSQEIIFTLQEFEEILASENAAEG